MKQQAAAAAASSTKHSVDAAAASTLCFVKQVRAPEDKRGVVSALVSPLVFQVSMGHGNRLSSGDSTARVSPNSLKNHLTVGLSK